MKKHRCAWPGHNKIAFQTASTFLAEGALAIDQIAWSMSAKVGNGILPAAMQAVRSHVEAQMRELEETR